MSVTLRINLNRTPHGKPFWIWAIGDMAKDIGTEYEIEIETQAAFDDDEEWMQYCEEIIAEYCEENEIENEWESARL